VGFGKWEMGFGKKWLKIHFVEFGCEMQLV
jgi:hypothetical protein